MIQLSHDFLLEDWDVDVKDICLLSHTATSPHLTFSLLTRGVAALAATVSPQWKESAGQVERHRGSRRPSMPAQIILTPEAT